MKEAWISLNFTCPHALADRLSEFLTAVGAEGVTVVDKAELEAFFAEKETPDIIADEFIEGLPETAEIVGYFAAEYRENRELWVRVNRDRQYSLVLYDDVPKTWQTLEDLLAVIRSELAELSQDRESSAIDFDYHLVRDEDWADNWKKHYDNIQINDRLVISPTWLDYQAKAGEVVIKLDPGSAFGTGSHETTALCLNLLSSPGYLEGCRKILDLGTGSGILAIAIKKLLGDNDCLVEAIDIDERAVKQAEENAEQNAVDIACYAGQLADSRQGHYDLIVANLVADILIPLAPQLKAKMVEGGQLVISGIIQSREDDVMSAYLDQDFQLKERQLNHDWLALAWQK